MSVYFQESGARKTQLKRVLRLRYGDALRQDCTRVGGVPVFGSNGKFGEYAFANASSPVLIVGRKGSVGSINWSPVPAFVSDTAFFVEPTSPETSKRWLFWLLQSLDLSALSRDVGVPGLPRESAYRMTVIHPPLKDQLEIAAFLDSETAKIDEAIIEHRRLIDLIRERRQIAIHCAVTKGINEDVALKNPESDWSGAIPTHWRSVPLKRIVSMKSGQAITADALSDSNPYPVYGGNGVRGRASEFTHDGEYVLIGRQGALCGNVHIASGKFWASEHAVVATPKLKDTSAIWLAGMLEAADLNRLSETAAQPGLAVGKIGNLRCPLPPADEMEQIAISIKRANETAQRLTDALTHQLFLLQERRWALISDAVTGHFRRNSE